MALVRLPSVLVDEVEEDFLGATAGAVLSDNEQPFSIMPGQTISIVVDGGAPQLVTFNDVDFDDLDAATAAEVVAVLNATLVGAVATVEGDRIRITTLTMGAAGSIVVVDEPEQHVEGGGPPAFDFPTIEDSGEDFAEQTLLINRIPEPTETGVPLSSGVEFEVHHVAGDGADAADITVTVNGVIVLASGAGLAGWAVGFSQPGVSTVRVELMPPDDFESDIDVEILVAVSDLGFSDLYAFRTADLVQPRVLSAVAQSRSTIRVTFSEAMRQLDPTAAGDALNPESYSIDYTTVPAASLRVTAVVPISPTQVDLVTDIEMTFGAGYELLTSQVRDIAGNVTVVAPDNVVAFVGFLPPFPAGRRFMLADFIPAMNLAEDASGDLRMFLAILQEVTNVLLFDIDEWAKIIDPDQAP